MTCQALLCNIPYLGLREYRHKAEVKRSADFLIEVREDILEGEGESALRLHLTELYRIIQRLMDATFATEDQGLKVLLATLEKRAREYKQEIEGRLGVRN